MELDAEYYEDKETYDTNILIDHTRHSQGIVNAMSQYWHKQYADSNQWRTINEMIYRIIIAH